MKFSVEITDISVNDQTLVNTFKMEKLNGIFFLISNVIYFSCVNKFLVKDNSIHLLGHCKLRVKLHRNTLKFA